MALTQIESLHGSRIARAKSRISCGPFVIEYRLHMIRRLRCAGRRVGQTRSCSVLNGRATVATVSDPLDRLAPADPEDLVGALAFALRYSGRKRVHNADEIMAEIVP